MSNKISNIIYGNSKTGINKIYNFKDQEIRNHLSDNSSIITVLSFLDQCYHGFGSEYSKDKYFSSAAEAIQSAFCIKKDV